MKNGLVIQRGFHCWQLKAASSKRSLKGKFEGAKPLQTLFLPLSFEGEGDRGGEVDNYLLIISLSLVTIPSRCTI